MSFCRCFCVIVVVPVIFLQEHGGMAPEFIVCGAAYRGFIVSEAAFVV